MSNLLRTAILVLVMALSVQGFSDLPSFPAMPASFMELGEMDTTPQPSHAKAPIMELTSLPEPKAASSFVELGEIDTSLPSSEFALAAALPEHTTDPVAAALAIEVPNPNTFLKDDSFIQQLEHEESLAAQREAAENGVESEVDAPSNHDFLDKLVAPPAPRASRRGVSGTFVAASGHSFPSNQRPAQKTQLPLHDRAPHQENIPRTYRTANGHFERNLAFRDSHKQDQFPHHGGHTKLPHNKGRRNAQANQPKPKPSRHLVAQRKSRGFPKSKSGRNLRRDNRIAASRAGGRPSLKARKQRKARKAVAKKTAAVVPPPARRAVPAPAPAAKPAPPAPAAVPAKAPAAAVQAKKKHHGLLDRIVDRVTDKVANKVEQKAKQLGNWLSKKADKVGAKAAAGLKKAGSKLKGLFGFKLMELNSRKIDTAAGAKAVPTAMEATNFPTGFEHIDQQRADMRAEVQQFKDVEFAATQAAADLERIKAIQKDRQDVIDAHIDTQLKLRANLNTMFGASNGIFNRLPTHATQGGRRGSNAQRSWTPARRIVPARLARLEDERMIQRRRTFARGGMAETYHQQLHGSQLGVGEGPAADYASSDSFLQMNEDGVVHDAPPPMESLPPM